MLRHHGEPTEQDDRIVFRRLRGIAQRRLKRAFKRVGDVVEVREEYHVEQPALAGFCNMLVEFGSGPIVLGELGLRVTPHAEAVIARSMHQELREMHFLLCHNRTLASLPDIATARSAINLYA